MGLYNTILVSIDLFPGSHQVFGKAVELAEQHDAKLCVIHVEPRPLQAAGSPKVHQLENSTGHKIRDLAERYNISQQNTHIAFGDPESEILDYAKNIKADLIVIGSHGKRGLRKLLGSTSNAVLNNAPCHIYLVKLSNGQ